jgi:large subunit ribosomal protein L29
LKKSTTELKELSKDELHLREQELYEELFNLRVRHSTGQLENPIQLRHLRRDIARVKTFLRQAEIPGSAAPAPRPEASGKASAGSRPKAPREAKAETKPKVSRKAGTDTKKKRASKS